MALLFNQAILSFLNAIRNQQFTHPEMFASVLTKVIVVSRCSSAFYSLFYKPAVLNERETDCSSAAGQSGGQRFQLRLGVAFA